MLLIHKFESEIGCVLEDECNFLGHLLSGCNQDRIWS